MWREVEWCLGWVGEGPAEGVGPCCGGRSCGGSLGRNKGKLLVVLKPESDTGRAGILLWA